MDKHMRVGALLFWNIFETRARARSLIITLLFFLCFFSRSTTRLVGGWGVGRSKKGEGWQNLPVDCLLVEGCVAAECGTLTVCSSLLGAPLLAALVGLSAPLDSTLASAMAVPMVVGAVRRAVGLGLGENNEAAVEYA